MRLIDANALKKKVDYFDCHECGDDCNIEFVTLDNVDNAPTIDAVPVVRCQDCKHRGKLYECPMRKIIHIEGEGGTVLDLSKDDGFCDRGEAWEHDEH